LGSRLDWSIRHSISPHVLKVSETVKLTRNFPRSLTSLMAPMEGQRRSERIQLEIPIRVIGFALEKNEFSEETTTIVVNREGGRIKLKQKIVPRSEIRIINLESYKEADFRVVGPTRLEGKEVAEWGVEYMERGHNIWGIDFPSPQSSEEEAGTLLECRVCHKQEMRIVSPMEMEALRSTGIVAYSCENCKKLTYWSYADARARAAELAPPDLIAPPVSENPVEKKALEKRKLKRLGMKLAILVRNAQGVEEIGKTVDVSRGGVAVALAMDLTVGDKVTIICPYSGNRREPGKKAEVRRRAAFPFNERRDYGFLYLT
jgi:hypothetical protein